MTRNKKLVRLMALAVATTTVATGVPVNAAFDANYYAAQNPDVVAVVGNTPAALEAHYNTFGKNEGRASNQDEEYIAVLRSIFDVALYAKQNPDVVAAFGNDVDKLFAHFLAFGMKEGRNISPYFDISAYMKAYPDLQNAFGADYAKYYIHFATCGVKEHRTLGGFPSEGILPGGIKAGSSSSSGGGGSTPVYSGGGASSSSSSVVDPNAAVSGQVAEAQAQVSAAKSRVDDAVAELNALTTGSGDEAGAVKKAEDLASALASNPDAGPDEKAEAVIAAQEALTKLGAVKDELTAAKTQAEAAKTAADEAVAAATTAKNTADGNVTTAEGEKNAAAQAVTDAQNAISTAEEAIATIDAVKANDNKYYKASEVDIDEETGTITAKANATAVDQTDCIAGLTDAYDTAITAVDADPDHKAAVEAAVEAYRTVKQDKADADAALVAAQEAAVDAYNEGKDDADKVSATNWDTITGAGQPFATWLAADGADYATGVETAEQTATEKGNALNNYDFGEYTTNSADVITAAEKKDDVVAKEAEKVAKQQIVDDTKDDLPDLERAKTDAETAYDNAVEAAATAATNLQNAEQAQNDAGQAVNDATAALQTVTAKEGNMNNIVNTYGTASGDSGNSGAGDNTGGGSGNSGNNSGGGDSGNSGGDNSGGGSTTPSDPTTGD